WVNSSSAKTSTAPTGSWRARSWSPSSPWRWSSRSPGCSVFSLRKACDCRRAESVRFENHPKEATGRIDQTRLRIALAALAALALALGVAACGGSDDTSGAENTSAEGGSGGGAITSNPENGKVSLTIGSKNFPEQEILGEIYTQALAAAGYKAK